MCLCLKRTEVLKHYMNTNCATANTDVIHDYTDSLYQSVYK